ncbi:O-antigen ligase family protein [Providencia manganoxydans]|uniref:O-antigen ligase family protein n=1 Tax=Providencia manganoxydans TaxID=2923283 RepID=UPI0034DD67DA
MKIIIGSRIIVITTLFLLFFSGMGGYNNVYGYGIVIFYSLCFSFCIYFLKELFVSRMPSKIIYLCPFFVWFIFILFSGSFAPDFKVHLVDFILTLTIWIGIAFFTLKLRCYDYKGILKKTIVIWCAINFLLYLLYIGGVFSINPGLSFSGLYENRNTLAVTGAFLLAVFINYSDTSFRSLVVGLVILFLIMSTASSKGVISGVIVYCIWIYSQIKSKRGIAFTVLCTFSIVILFYHGYFDEALARLLGRFNMFDSFVTSLGVDSIVSIHAQSSQNHRIELSKQALELFYHQPVWGYGLRGSEAFLRLGGGPTYTHNNYMEMLVSGGMVGFIFYYVPIFFLALILFLSKGKNIKYCSETRIAVSFMLLLIFNQSAQVSYKSFIILFAIFYVVFIVINFGREK